MHVALLLVGALALAQNSTHEEKNPLYRALLDKGAAIGKGAHASLPAPYMPDGLDAAGQKAIIAKLAGQVPLDEVYRDSALAKHFYKIHEVKSADPQAPAHQTDIWFLAYGDLDELAKKDARTLFSIGRKDTKVHELTAAEMSRRGLKSAGERDSVLSIRYTVFDEIQVRMTIRNVQSRTPESLVLARAAEPKFDGDSEYPNQWQRLKEDGNKLVPTGEAVRYDSFAQYMKVTRLAEPRGALFVETHQIFTEPRAWFEGNSVVRTKLPLLVQSEVRAFRRELKKWSSGS